jgi:hypothetical protein
MVWDGVTSAVVPDARKRDDGDAAAHRREALTPQMAPRRRNPKGGRHFAGGRWSAMRLRVETWIGRRVQSAGRDARIHSSAAG